ncbi:MAG: YdiY family protein [Nitrospinota bacterium]
MKNILKSLCIILPLIPILTHAEPPSAVQAQTAQDETEASLSLGLVQTSGNSVTTTFNSKANVSRKKGIYRIRLDGLYTYGESGGKSFAEKVDVTNRWEMRLNSYFPFWDISYYRDPFQKYDYRIATGPGLGYFFIKTDTAYLSASYYVRSQNDHLIGENEKYVNYTMQFIEERAKFSFTENLSLTQKLIYSISDRKHEDYFVNFEAALKNKINSRLALELSYAARYQNKPVDVTVKRLDATISTLLVIQY